jgi:uncharacterized protein YecE (DUF72 family)
MSNLVRIGTAGWAVPKACREAFPTEGSGLARYAAIFDAAEINTSFYRPHRPSTYARWAETVPDGFRFAVKLPRAITHERRLVSAREPLEVFLAEVSALGDRLGPLLIQLPPSLSFEPEAALPFLDDLRSRFDRDVVIEPRHASWFAPEVDGSLDERRIARVAADPARVPAAAEPGGWPGLVYYRLHGSPRMYYSAYPADVLDNMAARLKASAEAGIPAWCMFDNTASGAAAADALALKARLAG